MSFKEEWDKLETTNSKDRLQLYKKITKVLADKENSTSVLNVRNLKIEQIAVDLKDGSSERQIIIMHVIGLLSSGVHKDLLTSDQRNKLASDISCLLDGGNVTLCRKAFWCLSQMFPIHFDNKMVANVLTSLDIIFQNNKSVVMWYEALLFFQRLIKEQVVEMEVHIASVAKFVFLPLCHPASKIREVAHVTFELALSSLTEFQPSVSPVLAKVIRGSLQKDMLHLFDQKERMYVLKMWGHVVALLGTELHVGTSLCNLLMEVIEKGFKSQSEEILRATFIVWQNLVKNFSSDIDILSNPKRLHLALRPLKLNYRKYTSLFPVICETFWHVVLNLKDKLSNNFEQGFLLLLEFILPPLKENNESSLTNLTSIPEKDSSHLLKTACEMILRILDQSADTTASRLLVLEMPPLTLAALQVPVQTTVLLRHFKKLVKASRLIIYTFGNNDEYGSVIDVLIGSLLNIISQVPDGGSRDSVDSVVSFLSLVSDIISDKLCPSHICLKHLDNFLKLPQRMLTSHYYHLSGSGVMHDNLAVSLMKLLLNPYISSQHSSDSRFINIFKHLANACITNILSPLSYAQTFLNLIDGDCVQNNCDAELLLNMWSAIVTPLLDVIQKTQEVNQGDSLENDFSCIYAILLYPLWNFLPPKVSQAHFKGAFKLWTELYKTFVRCAALIPSVEDNAVCELFCVELKKKIKREQLQDELYFESVCQLLQVVVECINFIYASENSSKKDGAFGAGWFLKQKQKPIGNLTSVVDLLEFLLHCFCEKYENECSDVGSKETAKQKAARFTKFSISLDLVKSLMCGLTNPNIIPPVIEAVASPLSQIFSLSCKNRCTMTQFSTKLENLWKSIATVIQHSYKGPYDTEFLFILSPLLEATLSHSRRNIQEKSKQLWYATFAPNQSSLKYPDSLKCSLIKSKLLLSPSGINPVEDISEVATSGSLCDNTPDLDCATPILKSPFLRKAKTTSSALSENKKEETVSTRKKRLSKPNINELPDEEFVKIAPVSTSVRRRKSVRKSFLPAMYNELSQNSNLETCSLTSSNSTGEILQQDLRKPSEDSVHSACDENDAQHHLSAERTKKQEEHCEESAVICDSHEKDAVQNEEKIPNEYSGFEKHSTCDVPIDVEDADEIVQSSQDLESDKSACGKTANKLFSPRFFSYNANPKSNASHEGKILSFHSADQPKSHPSDTAAPTTFEGEVKETELFVAEIISQTKPKIAATTTASVNGLICMQNEKSKQSDVGSHIENINCILDEQNVSLKSVDKMGDSNSQITKDGGDMSAHEAIDKPNEETKKCDDSEAIINIEECEQNVSTIHESGTKSSSDDLFCTATVSNSDCISDTIKDMEPSAKVCETFESDAKGDVTENNGTPSSNGKRKLSDEEENLLHFESQPKKRKKLQKTVPHQKITRKKRNAELPAIETVPENTETSGIPGSVIQNSPLKRTEVSVTAVAEKSMNEDVKNVPTEHPVINTALSHDLFAEGAPLSNAPAVIHIASSNQEAFINGDNQPNELCEGDDMEDISQNGIEEIPSISRQQKVVVIKKTTKRRVSRAREPLKPKEPVRKNSPVPAKSNRNLRSSISKRLSLEPVKTFKSLVRSRRSLASVAELDILQNSEANNESFTETSKSNKSSLEAKLSEKNMSQQFDIDSSDTDDRNDVYEKCLDFLDKDLSHNETNGTCVSNQSAAQKAHTNSPEEQRENVCALESGKQTKAEEDLVVLDLCSSNTNESPGKETTRSDCDKSLNSCEPNEHFLASGECSNAAKTNNGTVFTEQDISPLIECPKSPVKESENVVVVDSVQEVHSSDAPIETVLSENTDRTPLSCDENVISPSQPEKESSVSDISKENNVTKSSGSTVTETSVCDFTSNSSKCIPNKQSSGSMENSPKSNRLLSSFLRSLNIGQVQNKSHKPEGIAESSSPKSLTNDSNVKNATIIDYFKARRSPSSSPSSTSPNIVTVKLYSPSSQTFIQSKHVGKDNFLNDQASTIKNSESASIKNTCDKGAAPEKSEKCTDLSELKETGLGVDGQLNLSGNKIEVAEQSCNNYVCQADENIKDSIIKSNNDKDTNSSLEGTAVPISAAHVGEVSKNGIDICETNIPPTNEHDAANEVNHNDKASVESENKHAENNDVAFQAVNCSGETTSDGECQQECIDQTKHYFTRCKKESISDVKNFASALNLHIPHTADCVRNDAEQKIFLSEVEETDQSDNMIACKEKEKGLLFADTADVSEGVSTEVTDENNVEAVMMSESTVEAEGVCGAKKRKSVTPVRTPIIAKLRFRKPTGHKSHKVCAVRKKSKLLDDDDKVRNLLAEKISENMTSAKSIDKTKETEIKKLEITLSNNNSHHDDSNNVLSSSISNSKEATKPNVEEKKQTSPLLYAMSFKQMSFSRSRKLLRASQQQLLGNGSADQKVMSSPSTLLAALSANSDSPALRNDLSGSPLSSPRTFIHGKRLTYADVPASPTTGILKKQQRGEKKSDISPVKKKVRFAEPLVAEKFIDSSTKKRPVSRRKIKKSKACMIILSSPSSMAVSKNLDVSNPISVCPLLVNCSEPLGDILQYVIPPSDLDNVRVLTSQHNVKTIGDLCRLSNRLLQSLFESYLDYDSVHKVVKYWTLQSQSSVFSHFSICEVSSSDNENKMLCCMSDKCETCITLRKENEKDATAASENSSTDAVEVLPKDMAEEIISNKCDNEASSMDQNKESLKESATVGKAAFSKKDLIDTLLTDDDFFDGIPPLKLIRLQNKIGMALERSEIKRISSLGVEENCSSSRENT